MPSAWIEHVKATYKGGKAGMSYKEAMVKAKSTWAKKKAGGKTEKADKPMKKTKKAKKKKDRADEHEEEEHDEKVESEPKRKRRLKKKSEY